MAAQIDLLPITDGMTDEWRVFVAELRGPRRIEWAQSQRRRGIVREVISLVSAAPDLVAVYTESPDHERADGLLEASDDPFDRWYRDRRSALLGSPLDTEILFDSAPRPGPWRGRR